MKRTDPTALMQLRVFNLYKFLVVLDVIERTQVSFLTINNKDDDITLYDKLYKFEERDVISQEYFDKKVEALRKLHLNFECFTDSSCPHEVMDYMNSDISNDAFAEPINQFCKIKDAITPLSKLKIVATLQKSIITILADHCLLKPHSINNDIVLPVLIYVIIYKMDQPLELLLNFNFIKNFVNLIDPYNVQILSNTSFYFYNPSDSQKSANKNISKQTTVFDCLNLNETNDADSESEQEQTIDFFHHDKQLVQFISSNYLNNSELQYYLTNFEAILFFIENVTADELNQKDVKEEILIKPLDILIEASLTKEFKFPEVKTEETGNRSRSGSLLNSLSNRITEARNRSRSNSGLLKNTREAFPTIDTTLEANSMISSPLASPTNSHDTSFENSSTFGMMKNIIGRFSSVSVPQFKAPEEEEGLLPLKHERSSSLIDKLGNRTRSPSIDTNNQSPSRRTTIASKLSSGVSDFMTKLNTTQPAIPSTQSQTSLKSFDESPQKRPEIRARTSSMQVMEKWFTNISNPQNHPETKPEINDAITESGEGSVFSTPSKELARYHNVDFDLLTILDLRTLKVYYDQLCNELGVYESKSTNEDMNNDPGTQEVNSI